VYQVLQVLFNQVFGQPFLLIGIVVFIGYMALKLPLAKAFSGALKASVGVIVLSVGAGQLISNFGVLVAALNKSFNMTGVLLDTYSTMAASNEKLGEFASWSVYTMLSAFLFNLIMVALGKYTKIRAVFLTGNVMIVQTAIATYIVYRFLHLSMIPTVLIAGFIIALYWGIFSTLLIKPTQEITGAQFTISHQQMLGSYVATKIAGRIGNPAQDIEKLKLPKWLNVFQDNLVASALVFLVSVVGIMTALGWGTVSKMAAGKNEIVYVIQTALTLAANIYILLTGVRLFVGEIMMSFQGISNRLLPGAIVGVDCAAIFGFSPMAVIAGFVCGAIGQICGILGLIIFKSSILIIPGFIPLFFDNATIGVYANKRGGVKALAILCFSCGLIQILGTSVVARLMDLRFWQGSFDWATVWLVIVAIFSFIGQLLGITPV